METVDFKSGETIIKNGEKGEFVYIIKSGRIKAVIASYEVILSGELPDVIGLEALTNEQYTETCTAVEDVKLIKCSTREFMDIYANTELGKKALESFVRRTAKAFGWF
ncbi:MAG: Crp/Fnr family transcriptional regulator [Fervidobacterium sp.]